MLISQLYSLVANYLHPLNETDKFSDELMISLCQNFVLQLVTPIYQLFNFIIAHHT